MDDEKMLLDALSCVAGNAPWLSPIAMQELAAKQLVQRDGVGIYTLTESGKNEVDRLRRLLGGGGSPPPNA